MYKSDEDKMMRDPKLKWSEPSVISKTKKMPEFKIGDEVVGVEHPKYGNKPFEGVAKITSVLESKGDKQWYWFELHEPKGKTTGMVSEDELINVKDTPLPTGLSEVNHG